jgi:phosphonate transport system substrate-binding protein
MFRFGLPPSLGTERLVEQTQTLRAALQRALGVDVDVVVTRDYDALRQAVLVGAVDGAHVPPFVCAQLEPRGVTIVARAVRRGRSTYASALVVKKGSSARLVPRTLRAAWVDPQSVAGHLLPKAHLRQQRHVVEHFFVDEAFYGSYGAALAAVVDGRADVAGAHVIPGDAQSLLVSLEAHLPGASSTLAALQLTAEVPGDGIAVHDAADAARVQRAFAALPKALLDDVFKADAFEPATPGGYRPLYAIAPPEF